MLDMNREFIFKMQVPLNLSLNYFITGILRLAPSCFLFLYVWGSLIFTAPI